MRETVAIVEIAWHATLAAAAAPLVRLLPGETVEPRPIVPSSLRHDDAVAAEVRTALRARGVRTTVMTPRTSTAGIVRRGTNAWTTQTIAGQRWRVDARLASAPWVAIVTIDAKHRTGPFALDLAARFLHPADRVRLAVLPDRLRAIADIASIAPPVTCLLATPVDGGWLTVATRDLIAAELWALALAERFHPAELEMQGPWEEPAVQRATELGLGIRIPGDMRICWQVPERATTPCALVRYTVARLGASLDEQSGDASDAS